MCINLHSKVLSSQKGDHLCLVANLHCVFKRLDDIVPHYNLLLRFRVDQSFDMDYFVGVDKSSRVEWKVPIDGAERLDLLQREVALGHIRHEKCIVSVGELVRRIVQKCWRISERRGCK